MMRTKRAATIANVTVQDNLVMYPINQSAKVDLILTLPGVRLFLVEGPRNHTKEQDHENGRNGQIQRGA